MLTLDHKITETLAAAEQFSAFLDEETAALGKADYRTFSSMQEMKMHLAQKYQDSILSFEDDLPHLKNLPENAKDRLRRMHTRYAESAQANEKALLAAKNVTERMVKLIMNAAKQTVMDGPSYSAAGVQGISEKMPIHFKLNETL